MAPFIISILGKMSIDDDMIFNSTKLITFLCTTTLVYCLYRTGAVQVFYSIATAMGGMINDRKETAPADGMPILFFRWACLHRAAVGPMLTFGTWGCH